MNLTALHVRISGQSILASVSPGRMQNGMDPATFQGFVKGGAETAFGYEVPNLLIDHAMRNPHVPAGFWRGVNINQNAVYIESFMDELATAAGVDPLEFRRRLMRPYPNHLAALNAVADQAGWGKPAPQGVYRGLAQMMAFGSYVAACAEVSVDGNKVKIHRIVGATDPGYAVNPAQIERQIAGSFVYGLTGLFYGECTVKDGAIEQTNFDSYDMMRIAQMPKVEAIVMPSGSGVWGGVGEPTICVAAPAVLNAITAATGKRYRSFPLKNQGLTLV
jgi:isoquinoline 1-oxidoreductase subunit beta